MKRVLLFALPLFTGFAYSQVGINSTVPTSTLDVKGKLGNADKDGLQAPRLTRAQLTDKGNTLYTANQIGALIYITDISGGDAASPQRTNVTSVGYYYFDGTLWISLKPTTVATTNNLINPTTNTLRSTVNGVAATPDATIVSTVGNTVSGNTIATTVNNIAGTAVTIPNLYTANGSLTGDRIVTQANNTLTFNTTTAGGTKLVSNGTASAQKSAVQIVDGGEANGKYLMSDASGNATWRDVNITAVPGSFATTIVTLPNTTGNGNYRTSTAYTGAYIDLPIGKWMINLGSTIGTGGTRVTGNGLLWASFWIGDSSTYTSETGNYTSDFLSTYSGRRAGAGSIVVGSYKGFVTGSYAVEVKASSTNYNTTTKTKRFYIYLSQEKEAIPDEIANNTNLQEAFYYENQSRGVWERYLYALPIK